MRTSSPKLYLNRRVVLLPHRTKQEGHEERREEKAFTLFIRMGERNKRKGPSTFW